jgi:hypothetical protein
MPHDNPAPLPIRQQDNERRRQDAQPRPPLRVHRGAPVRRTAKPRSQRAEDIVAALEACHRAAAWLEVDKSGWRLPRPLFPQREPDPSSRLKFLRQSGGTPAPASASIAPATPSTLPIHPSLSATVGASS